MEVIVTEWGLQSYIKLKGKSVFSDNDYRGILRPDAERLKLYPGDPKFGVDKFWGPAKFAGKIVKYGHKMKWHNFGNGNVQLRLCVVIAEVDIENVKMERAFLCTSYVKDTKTEKLEMAGMKTKIRKILDGNFVYRGKL